MEAKAFQHPVERCFADDAHQAFSCPSNRPSISPRDLLYENGNGMGAIEIKSGEALRVQDFVSEL